MKLLLRIALCLTVASCSSSSNGDTSSSEQASVPLEVEKLTAAQVELYLRYLSPVMAARGLSPQERALISDAKSDALGSVLQSWTQDEAFADLIRDLMETGLRTSGQQNGIDHNLPGQLVWHTVKQQAPWAEILTSKTCYDDKDLPIPCDTGAPYTAGVLSTRGFLASNAGRFNLLRSRTLMKVFACQDYPQPANLQPLAEKQKLIAMFRAETQTDQLDEKAKDGFGNGFACYSCHGQFAYHSQLFVKFDRTGQWLSSANGQQNPNAQPGDSFNGTSTSHFESNSDATSENSNMLGQNVAHLGDAAKTLSTSPTFIQCTAKRFLEHVLSVEKAQPMDVEVVQDIVTQIAAKTNAPSMQEIALNALLHPSVVRHTVIQLLEEQAP